MKVNDKNRPIKTKELILLVQKHQNKIFQCVLAFSGILLVPASHQQPQGLYLTIILLFS